ncbi:Prolyl-tRNA synthetase [Prochlorococcus sp. SS52]|nr:Prolyl-tRNA synthetase [Prochlorococcus marinus str. LG]KGG21512.1 Prolyl-tRNA synthetase [Prochlorococcus marinus str. SS2]KGG23143.1 Prolyl-tRNA synthetase [Prochlorococcus marinus str. SS35]KGG33854.1 Prolyl-tRNA synthetase [Prochlorococcus marinus str. SS51]KGG36797.1 Prolyl-tRNA synthetase [Prochlorococcus sp. SS52]
MPLMWKVIKKITSIVQEELDSKGCLETLLPQLHPAELWKESGRWDGYTAGEGIMFHLSDRQGRELGLGPTHEEVITKIANEFLQSYKQLPVNLYQIQTKFRDEIRPRFGLMRSREFIMKDAYSFHADETNLKETYLEMNDAYEKIFKRCGLETVAVDADSGAIGGAESREFMVTAEAGEDLILLSPDKKYAANQEKAISKFADPIFLDKKEPCIIQTNGQRTIKELCDNQGFHPSQILKVIILLAVLEKNDLQPILVSIRGDQELNEVKLINAVSKYLKKSVISIKTITKEQLDSQKLLDIPLGFVGPDLKDSYLNKAANWNKKFIRFTDITASNLDSFICGANTIDQHRAFVNWSKVGGLPEIVDIRNAMPGDISIHDPKQKLIAKRGIEVGHIFQLGRKYSSCLQASFTNEMGLEEPFWMGCYGIGISRLAQASVEQNYDQSGIIWPLGIAPFEVIVIVANMKDDLQRELGEKLYSQLKDEGVDVLIDDRKERAGVKFKDADLIGIPWKIISGRDSATGIVELVERSTGISKSLKAEEAIKELLEEISNYKKSILQESL